MTDSFIRTIAAQLYDDAPRLVYADWLEEHGDPKRAEFIRVQCELEPIRDRYEIDHAVGLHAREDELLHEHRDDWLGPMPEGWDDWHTGESVEFRRGFPDTLLIPARTFLELGPAIRRLHPTIRRLVLFRVNGYGERLSACQELEGLPELELACWYSDADAEAVAASPHLGQLQVLELWLGRRDPLSDGRLCEIVAGSRAWPRLRELTLLNPDAYREPDGESLVALANQAAGRAVAVYRRGWPERFPFAADFWYTFPGYLPNGRMAMANEDHRTSPPTLCVITFDPEGNQTDEVVTVPLPDDILAVPVDDWYDDKDRMQEHLTQTIGFRPGFIRVRGCHFPGDEDRYYSPAWDIDAEEIGLLDSDDESSDEGEPRGARDRVYRKMRNGEYVLGWDRYADKRGRVYFT